ncbi:hypothetical protein K438DRAFT_2102474 [Mycena galopus ATCC 62051]|nr:hypothetical protein K438DRAFT_2102474 [Mycena galopus ATCC 62051]
MVAVANAAWSLCSTLKPHQPQVTLRGEPKRDARDHIVAREETQDEFHEMEERSRNLETSIQCDAHKLNRLTDFHLEQAPPFSKRSEEFFRNGNFVQNKSLGIHKRRRTQGGVRRQRTRGRREGGLRQQRLGLDSESNQGSRSSRLVRCLADTPSRAVQENQRAEHRYSQDRERSRDQNRRICNTKDDAKQRHTRALQEKESETGRRDVTLLDRGQTKEAAAQESAEREDERDRDVENRPRNCRVTIPAYKSQRILIHALFPAAPASLARSHARGGRRGRGRNVVEISGRKYTGRIHRLSSLKLASAASSWDAGR